MINYPPKPWYDGQTFIHESSSGNKSKGTYYADKQGWSFTPLNEDGETGDGTITTLTVKTINQRPTVTRDPFDICLLYTSPSPRDRLLSRMPSSA